MSRKRPVRRSERRRRRFQAEAAGTVQPPRVGESEREYEQRQKRRDRPARPGRGPTLADTLPPPWEGGGVWFDERTDFSRADYDRLRELRLITGNRFVTFDPATENARAEIQRFPYRPGEDWTDNGHSDPASDIRELYRRWKAAHPPAYLLRVFGDFLRDEIGPDLEEGPSSFHEVQRRLDAELIESVLEAGKALVAGGDTEDPAAADDRGGGEDSGGGPENTVH